ncbi:TauD/TfdA family dioxygenase [Roseomonas sp. CECT 9278]|uniref:TauD/TfdA dioxygenase family protein n=1 Tax=Roseomonas sp. CECT 9278 TaxID=2845823 RepID=UPI001E4C3BC0|nr:TauD/TfdA family dioxygenase [Roseomonas sp. CECT 9278]CAH0302084.1 Alpha-ketoglutarate-dependent taurine dioxygenase [Roseomonas sp. CECT 9278]
MSITAQRVIVTRASGSCGAEVSGIDFRDGVDAATIAALRATWLDHGVLFLRDVDLPPRAFLDFAQHFGTPVEYPFVRGLEGFPQITPVVKEPHERVNFGGVWHSDTAYLERPPMATMLVARETPPAGGDTLFADARAAYDALSDGLRATLDGLRAINSSKKADASKTREDRQKERGAVTNAEVLEASHPVVRTHPETGRRALYVNLGHTTQFEGWTAEESKPLLDYLFAHLMKPEFTCRFRWAPGSLALWDNRAVQHYPVNDYHGHRREMHRITLAGDVPA